MMSSGTERIERKLAAIFCADVADYSRLMHADEVQTLRTLTAHRAIMDGLIGQHGGRIANTAGDSVLAEFSSVVDAVECAVAVQEKLAEANAGVAEDRALRFRIGIHVGDVALRGGDLLGDGVNVAARVQALADPGGVWLSEDAHRQVTGKIDRSFDNKGERQVKNIARPVRVYALADAAPSRSQAKPLPLPDKPSIAVLPFTNMSGDPEQEYFADGVVEDIITALSRIKWFFVIARNSSFTYKGRATDVRDVSRTLGVRYVLEGSIRRSGAKLRITAQLIDGETGRHVWADRYDGEFQDVFEFQDRITETVVGAIEPSIRRAEIDRALQKPTKNLAAYDRLLCALPLIAAADKLSIIEAQAFLFEATVADPRYALAYALRAVCCRLACTQHWATDAQRREGERLARHAISIGPDDSLALSEAAKTLAYLTKDYETASGAVERSLQLNPSSAAAHGNAGWLRNYMEEPDRALSHFEQAARLSPLDPEMFHFVTGQAVARLQQQQWGEARALAERALSLNPRWATAHRARIIALVELGRLAEATAAGSEFLRVAPQFSVREYRTTSPFRTDAFWPRWVDALADAGLPE